MNTLKLMYLGKMQVWQGDSLLTGFISRKAEALLCFLAVTGQPQSRDVLASLFWEDTPEANARRSLRVTLSNLRQLLGSHLHSTNQMVTFVLQPDDWLDITPFTQLFLPQTLVLTTENAPLFEKAAEIYTGEFLAGFHVRQAPAWEEWVLGQREQYNLRAWYVFHQLTRYFAGLGDYQKGLFYAARLLALDPMQEEAHRQLMRLLAASGQRTAAMSQYDTCCRLLSEELGVLPTAETVQLYVQIRDGVFPGQPARTIAELADAGEPGRQTRPYHLPSPPTPFVGRLSELADISRLLHTDSCRVITLMGPGGVGKTRLAIQAGQIVAAEPTARFSHGVFFIPLAAISDAAHLAPAFFNNLPGVNYGPGDPQRLLLNYLRHKEILLILDNLEHLLASVIPFLGEIIHTAPGVKLIITSREALNLPGEWALAVDGLLYPEIAAASATVEEYSAMQLFLLSARRLVPGFAQTPAELTWVARICQLVEGLPLALELASTWVQALTAAEIAIEIEQNLDFLSSTSLHGVPERHQSLRAVFDHSWRLLSTSERDVLRRLAIFRGGFAREAAAAVAGADVVMLSNLVHKFMVRRYRDGRYGLHILLRQYLLTLLRSDAGTLRAVGERHADYYLTHCYHLASSLKGGAQKEALQTLRTEIKNVRAAWQWAVKHKATFLLECAGETLYLFYEICAWMQEGYQAFSLAVQQLAWAEPMPESERTIFGLLLAWQARFAYRLGYYEAAQQSLNKSLTIFREQQATTALAFVLDQLATLSYLQADYDQAREYAHESLKLYRQSDEPFGLAAVLNTVGTLHFLGGQHTEAQHCWVESLTICQMQGDQRGAARARLNLGSTAVRLQAYQTAQQHYQECLAAFQELGDRRGTAITLNNLGTVAEMMGAFKEARTYHRESLLIYRESGDPGMITALEGLGNVACELSEFAIARAHFQEALALSREQGILPLTLNVLTAVARLYSLEGAGYQAAELAAFCAHHPASRQENKERAQALLLELAIQLPEADLTTATTVGQAKEIEDFLTGFSLTPQGQEGV